MRLADTWIFVLGAAAGLVLCHALGIGQLGLEEVGKWLR